MEFKDKVVMITGATGGIGKACAVRYAKDEALLALLGRSAEKLEALRSELGLTKDRCVLYAGDISSEAYVRGAVQETLDRFGRIDVLINTAGNGGPAVLTEDYSYEDFKTCYETNVYGTFLTMKYVLPAMKLQKSGAIVNTGSSSGIRGYELESGYGSSKWATIGLTKNVASENADTGVRINSVSPGWVDTKMMAQILENYAKKSGGDPAAYFSTSPMGRAGTPEEIAEGMYYLTSSKASYANGTNLVLDGGSTIG
ncbi:MAG: SDR family NAD(P)-dependent oxidoreductase [Eubacteriales bacterium]|jgi:NAD(P)-dependent dehydrogenase (short-subunit alcohol dehydrogenase family)|nr:SDR family NAD(P)-dependent oxidoreductase [Eubacteriales bacterium]